MKIFRNQNFVLIAIATTIFVLAIKAIYVMLFGSLGKTLANAGWNYALILYIFLAAIPILYYLSTINKLRSSLFETISNLLSGALLGFYYSGIAADKDPQIAVIGAISSCILFAIGQRQNYYLFSVINALISSICAYGFAFFTGTLALSLFNVSMTLSGFIWTIFCFTYLFLAINNFMVGKRKIVSVVKEYND